MHVLLYELLGDRILSSEWEAYVTRKIGGTLSNALFPLMPNSMPSALSERENSGL